jgi:hypothetical protein
MAAIDDRTAAATEALDRPKCLQAHQHAAAVAASAASTTTTTHAVTDPQQRLRLIAGWQRHDLRLLLLLTLLLLSGCLHSLHGCPELEDVLASQGVARCCG